MILALSIFKKLCSLKHQKLLQKQLDIVSHQKEIIYNFIVIIKSLDQSINKLEN